MKKQFDCVEMKHRASISIIDDVKGMSLEEKMDYWQKRNEVFQKEQESIQYQHPELVSTNH
jgi:hypothetical protein